MINTRLSPRPDTGTATLARVRHTVQGVVQGVGFRPFVHRLALDHALSGFVRNDSAGVTIEVEGMATDLLSFQAALHNFAPPAAKIDAITSVGIAAKGATGFAILESQQVAAAHTLVAPDIAICDDCLRELFDPTDRRYRYPFINCTNCGPRYTIVRGVPYDRPLTTMATFALCPTCAREYRDPANRRFHAQPNACPTCGPQVQFCWLGSTLPRWLARRFSPGEEAATGEDALQLTQQLLAHESIIAVKGIGGFHLACDATSNQAVARLRQLKRRGDKPFAIMARDLASVLQIAHVNSDEITLLTSSARPIVLLKRRAASPLSAHVAPGNPLIGVMLPYTPLHHLIFAPAPQSAPQSSVEAPPWLVMTSANHSGEPIITDDTVARQALTDFADALLLHNRPIIVPCDDSVVRVIDAAPLPIRRARGYAPLPIRLPLPVPATLAVGGEIKNTFCLAEGQRAFMSQHIGDMQTLETQACLAATVAHMQRLFSIQPEIVACDLHPSYLSTRWAQGWALDHQDQTHLVQVQHHHAHVATLMAEHGLRGDRPVIGFCFDGTGFGPDGAIWGGEVLIAGYRDYERVAHLAYTPLPGGDAAIHKPYRMALAALWAAGVEWNDNLPPVLAASANERAVLLRQLQTGLNCVPTSSMGRLFDAVAALCGVRHVATYEAQAAIELEALAGASAKAYHFALPTSPATTFDATPVLQAIVADRQRNVPPAEIASRFHNAVANLILEMSLRLRAETGINQVALTGGVFQNKFLLQQTVRRLRAAHFEPLVHRTLPPNDGGLALGQAMVAAHKEF